MTIDEINTIRLALDTPEHNRHYVKHVTDAKMILNKEQEAINYNQCCKSDSEQLICEECQEVVDALEDDGCCEDCSFYVAN